MRHRRIFATYNVQVSAPTLKVIERERELWVVGRAIDFYIDVALMAVNYLCPSFHPGLKLLILTIALLPIDGYFYTKLVTKQ